MTAQCSACDEASTVAAYIEHAEALRVACAKQAAQIDCLQSGTGLCPDPTTTTTTTTTTSTTTTSTTVIYPPFFYIFVSTGQFAGFDVRTSDAACRAEGATLTPPGSTGYFISMYSLSTESLAARVTSNGPYRMPLGAGAVSDIIANNEQDLYDGSLPFALDRLVDGTQVNDLVWTGSSSVGGTYVGGHCDDWTSPGLGPSGIVGRTTQTSGLYLSSFFADCSQVYPVYCIEVPPPPPTQAPTKAPTDAPTQAPTKLPTKAPTDAPTQAPTKLPTKAPTDAPTQAPTKLPTKAPTDAPTQAPTKLPTATPTAQPAINVYGPILWDGNFAVSYSQANYVASLAINNAVGTRTCGQFASGWGVNLGMSQDQTLQASLTTKVNPEAVNVRFNFELHQYWCFSNTVGHFRISETTDDPASWTNNLENVDVQSTVPAATWTPLALLNFKSSNGDVAVAGTLPNSLRVTYTGAGGDAIYTFHALSSTQGVTGFRLEVFKDGDRTPGMSGTPDGNFVLTEWKFGVEEAAPSNVYGAVPWGNDFAVTFSQSTIYTASKAVDNFVPTRTCGAGEGWAIYNTGTIGDNTLQAALATPANPEGNLVVYTFTFKQWWCSNHAIGLFRVSATQDESALWTNNLENVGVQTTVPSATWTVLTLQSFVSSNGDTAGAATPTGALQVGYTGTAGDAEYTFYAATTLARVTGFRLEVFLNGDYTPGMSRQLNGGNFVLHEWTVEMQLASPPTMLPTKAPTDAPTQAPTKLPTKAPTDAPTQAPTKQPTDVPTKLPTKAPTDAPTEAPTPEPTAPPAVNGFDALGGTALLDGYPVGRANSIASWWLMYGWTTGSSYVNFVDVEIDFYAMANTPSANIQVELREVTGAAMSEEPDMTGLSALLTGPVPILEQTYTYTAASPVPLNPNTRYCLFLTLAVTQTGNRHYLPKGVTAGGGLPSSDVAWNSYYLRQKNGGIPWTSVPNVVLKANARVLIVPGPLESGWTASPCDVFTSVTAASITTATCVGWHSRYTIQDYALPIHLEWKVVVFALGNAMFGLHPASGTETPANFDTDGYDFYHQSNQYRGNFPVYNTFEGFLIGGQNLFEIDIDGAGNGEARVNSVLRYSFTAPVSAYNLMVASINPYELTDIVFTHGGAV